MLHCHASRYRCIHRFGHKRYILSRAHRYSRNQPYNISFRWAVFPIFYKAEVSFRGWPLNRARLCLGRSASVGIATYNRRLAPESKNHKIHLWAIYLHFCLLLWRKCRKAHPLVSDVQMRWESFCVCQHLFCYRFLSQSLQLKLRAWYLPILQVFEQLLRW